MAGCPLAKVNHALAMNEKDFMNLIHDVERHEDAVTEDAKEIRELKVDVWELSNLVRLPHLTKSRATVSALDDLVTQHRKPNR